MTATQATIKEVDAGTLKRWLDEDKAILIDVREQMEYAREHIIGARHVPLSGFDEADFPNEHDRIAVFHCGTGRRTATNTQRILATGFKETYHLDGGLAAWKQAGLPVHFNKAAPIDLMRQVQIAAGSLVVLGVVLGLVLSPWFLALSAFVGAGLMFAGISGFCGMATLLGLAPWNGGDSVPPGQSNPSAAG